MPSGTIEVARQGVYDWVLEHTKPSSIAQAAADGIRASASATPSMRMSAQGVRDGRRGENA
jgi:hypothetical protein